MPEPLHVLVILGSVREGRVAEPVGKWVVEQSDGRKGLACEIVDLKEWDLPFYPYADAPAKGNYTDPLQQRWAEKVASADAYVLIAPEYNHGPPAVLKNALDFVYAEWNRKPVSFVGYGGNGGARAIEQLTAIARELRMAALEASVHIMGVWGKVQDGAFTGDERDVKWLGHLFDDIEWWGDALRTARNR